MSSFDLELQREIEIQTQNELRKIQRQCENILQDEIDKIYDLYDPHFYKRTYQLRNSIRTDIKNGELYVYINTGDLHYEDFHGNDVSKFIPDWLNYGHNSDKYEKFMLFQYPSRNFLESAKERIEELGVKVEIMSNIK